MTDVVYFVRRDGLVKIGTTGGLSSRIASLSRGCSAAEDGLTGEVELLAAMPGGRAVEKSIHEMFASLRYAREWFFLEEPLTGFIRAVDAAESVARAHRARARAQPQQLTPWVHVEEYAVPKRLRTQPSYRHHADTPAGDNPDAITLRRAVQTGVVPWRFAAAKKRMQRGRATGKERVPVPARREGLADVYRVDDLIEWVESELVP